jgi:NADPH2:quinone reductase
MRAIAVTSFGGPDVLQLRELPDPQPGPGQVVIRVAYAGVNFAEILGRRGNYRGGSLPFVPGLEVSGHIHAIGEDVEGFALDQPVAALTVTGGYAELVVVPALFTIPLDDTKGSIDLRIAAAVPVVVPTATALLSEVARVRPGESVLIHAASGGIGTVAVQIARLLQAGPVIGTVGREEKRDYARSFGYDHVVLQSNFADRVRQETHGRGVDVVLESIGGESFLQSLELLAPLGRLVYFGNASGRADIAQSTETLRANNKAVLGFSISSLRQQDPQRVAGLLRQALLYVTSGQVRIDISEIFPLDQVSEAHRRMESRSHTGKMLLRVQGGE